MAKRMITVCDNCGAEADVGKRRVGNELHLFTLDLCATCAELLDQLIGIGLRAQPARASMRALTPAEVRKAKRAAQKRP